MLPVLHSQSHYVRAINNNSGHENVTLISINKNNNKYKYRHTTTSTIVTQI